MVKVVKTDSLVSIYIFLTVFQGYRFVMNCWLRPDNSLSPK